MIITYIFLTINVKFLFSRYCFSELFQNLLEIKFECVNYSQLPITRGARGPSLLNRELSETRVLPYRCIPFIRCRSGSWLR
jgi:hypothetical protein